MGFEAIIRMRCQVVRSVGDFSPHLGPTMLRAWLPILGVVVIVHAQTPPAAPASTAAPAAAVPPAPALNTTPGASVAQNGMQQAATPQPRPVYASVGVIQPNGLVVGQVLQPGQIQGGQNPNLANQLALNQNRALQFQAALAQASRERRQQVESIVQTAQATIGQMMRMVAAAVESRMLQTGFRGPVDFVPNGAQSAPQVQQQVQQQLQLLNQVVPSLQQQQQQLQQQLQQQAQAPIPGAPNAPAPAPGSPINTVQFPPNVTAGVQTPNVTGVPPAATIPPAGTDPAAAAAALASPGGAAATTPTPTPGAAPLAPLTPAAKPSAATKTNATAQTASRQLLRQRQQFAPLMLVKRHEDGNGTHVHMVNPTAVARAPTVRGAAAGGGVPEQQTTPLMNAAEFFVKTRHAANVRHGYGNHSRAGLQRNDGSVTVEVPASLALVIAVFVAMVLL